MFEPRGYALGKPEVRAGRWRKPAEVNAVEEVAVEDAQQVESKTLTTPPEVSDAVRAKHEETCTP